MLHRRLFLKVSGAAGLASAGPRLTFASAPTEKRLIVVILRGGLDGLHAVAPYADPHYRQLRPRLALNAPGRENGVLDLDGAFGLHPILAPLHRLYSAGEMLVIPAVASRYRGRSHFDGQNTLENGTGVPFGAKDGWLNRAIVGLNQGDNRLGLALGPTIPFLLQGRARVSTWADSSLPKTDENLLKRIAYTYRNDPLFARTLADALGSMSPAAGSMGRDSQRGRELAVAARAAADLLSRANGPRIAVMESQGWDTHFAQARRLSILFEQLSTGIVTLKKGLSQHWRQTVVMVVSEFGRTAAENGSGGTDHGTGGLSLLLGGAVRGGRVAGEWPGLSQTALKEGRDIRPTMRYESLFKATLINHLALAPAIVEEKIFPNSHTLAPAEDLFHTG